MPTLLRVDASPSPTANSRALTDTYVAAWTAANPGAEVHVHDLAELDLPHISATELAAWYTPIDQQSEMERLVLARSDRLIADLVDADEIVIGSPMWNFGVPSALKAWIDHVIRVGRTVAVGPSGYTGQVTAHRAVLVLSRGGDFRPGAPHAPFDHQEPYLRNVLTFLGVATVESVIADHQGPTWDDSDEVNAAAAARLAALATPVPVA